MKKYIVTGLIILGAVNASAFMLQQGTKEVGVDGTFDVDSPDGSLLSADVRMGRFIQYGWLLGGELSLRNSDSVTLIGGTGFSEWNFPMDSALVPFLGARLGLATADVDGVGSETALIVGGEAGGKLFLAENVAVSLQLNLDLATSDIFPEDDGVGNFDARITLGLRYFFP